MNKKLVKLGVGGAIITAICCFTPVLVWILGAIGLVAIIAYLDYVLFPLLAVFFAMIVIGLVRKKPTQRNQRNNLKGQPAVPFKLLDSRGKTRHLDNYKGSWLLMVFHRHLG
jgi:mercuric ion transport protein